ncbi:MAG: hypothetical protein CL878_11530 [Dehalococcoidia bacterium]|nr:hypothetical protein [Dehalococcoidia bacterium]
MVAERHDKRQELMRRVRYAVGVVGGAFLALLPHGVLAHGDRTGVADLIVDYGLPAFLVIMVVMGAAVAAWLSLRPLPAPEDPEAEDGAATGQRSELAAPESGKVLHGQAQTDSSADP